MTNSEDKILFLIWTRRGDEKFLFDTLFDRSKFTQTRQNYLCG